MKYQRPKGTADILPGESEKWSYVEDTARLLFDDYQFHEIRTPLFENFEVFSRSAGDTSDVVTKEMYDFHDKGDRHIALRPEGTAGVVRAYVENKLYAPEQEKPYKVFYMGQMYRYERPQSGRMREFHQIGVEAFGSDSPAVDVEVMAMAMDFFKQLGVTNLKLAINSLGDKETRAAYHQALVDYLEPHMAELSEDSQARLHKNPLRVLDSKDKHDQEIVADAPSILDFLTPTAQNHLDSVTSMLTALAIPFEVDATMVRGLDYYNHTIFEIESQSPALGRGWTTICGGGRYNGLVEELGGPETPGFGFGIGMERLLLLLQDQDITAPIDNPLDVYVVGIGEATNVESLKLVQAIRGAGFSADRDYMDRKPKAQFKTADRRHARMTMTIGEQELTDQTVNVKNMATGDQTTVPLSEVYTDFAGMFDKYFDED
ncbi:histidine--tRNA ligase [Furfurilactobacillus siliginis]|uniref:Histidine--tRNA ligase n=1 Tax=Furfurilactobacillus siliginis TaxID=348151 RepID=A0A0R2L6R1_9LACO|nr:histidine--tRNA ligase [Furfurilactobacillus siliginis]KRN97056.1 histidyl-tRNA synthetase [Furfurilactobacillus siliginis]GEK27817.1 histidine--tRNA ligase [Furfurilactobacillus siliginis]